MECTNEMHSHGGGFVRVSENPCRDSSGGIYYAPFRANGKEISRSLLTTDRTIAKRFFSPRNAKITMLWTSS